jgi:hypothetical protein
MDGNPADTNWRKSGGPKTRRAHPCVGVARAMRERERQSPGVFRADARQGELTRDLVPMRSSRSSGRSDTEVGGGVAEGERLRWDG